MLFNTYEFAIFFIIVFILYWFVLNKSIGRQNILLVISSYFFYGCWDYRFMLLLAFSTFLDFFLGNLIFSSPTHHKRKIWLALSVTANLAFLGLFKYYNFFVESFIELLEMVGIEGHITTLQIILPVGISFYTFHGLSYAIDIYNKKIDPEKNIITYFCFVSFFPLLVAGPIERATHLLPQLNTTRSFSYAKASDGMRQILWGLFKKMVIADNCAEFANTIFNGSTSHSGSTLLLGAFFFTLQIYGDFSGYSDIALGVSRLLGIELIRNFSFPYFSRDIAEFWRRWHISLSSWFRDYVYIPLGGSKHGHLKTIRNTFIIFLISGFWHGANWTFIVWGGLNALFILPSVILKTNRQNLETVAQGHLFPSLKETFQILRTFSLTMLAWIFFRSETIKQAIEILSEIFSTSIFSSPNFPGMKRTLLILLPIGLFILIEWMGREGEHALAALNSGYWNKALRWAFYSFILFMLFYFAGTSQQFIYFQF